MEKLWTAYIEGDLPLSVTLKSAYASYYDLKPEWLEMTNETVESYVQRLLLELEQLGYDLDNTEVNVLQERFVNAPVSINPPLPYIQLSTALIDLDLQIEQSIKNEYPELVISKLKEIKSKIELELMSMK